MALTAQQQAFIKNIATAVNKYRESYGIKIASSIIAQAILESGWGKSTLASKYHNYFGMKCGSAWKGKSVNMTTQEEYTTGTLTTIKDNFRVYDSLDEGVKGYFVFINTSRYSNLKGVTDPRTYLERIKADGYATSSKYVDNLMNVVNTYNLTQYDSKSNSTSSTTTSTTPSVSYKTYTVVSGDTLSKIGNKLGVKWQDIASLNNIKSPYIIYRNQVLKVPNEANISNVTVTSTYKKYTVIAGDSLSKIGSKLGVKWQDIARLNGISSPYIIRIGQTLKIPN